jgi:hypothetical protein
MTAAPPASAKNQRSRILRLLMNAQGAWVPSPEIAACAQQYNARLYELRQLGFVIENRIETDESTSERRSWFRLVREAPTQAATPTRDWYIERFHRPRPSGKPQRQSDGDLPLFAGVEK